MSFHAFGRAAGAAVPYVVPRLFPFAASGPLLFLGSALIVAMVAAELYRQWRLMRPPYMGYTPCGSGATEFQNWGGGLCSSNGVNSFNYPNTSITQGGVTFPSVWGMAPPFSQPTPTIRRGLQTMYFVRVISNQPFWKYPLVIPATFPLDPPDYRRLVGAAVMPIEMPFNAGVDDVVRIPVWAAVPRARFAATVAVTSQSQSRGNALPIADVLPARALPRIIPLPQGRVLTQAGVLPLTAAVPAQVPRPGTNEIKTRAFPIVSTFLRAVVGIPSELNDALDALHSALPKKCQKLSGKRIKQNKAIKRDGRYNAKYKRARNDNVSMLRAIAACGEYINIPDATRNLIQNELVDRAYGGAGKSLGQLNRQANMPLGVQMLVGKAPKADNYLSPRRPVNIPYDFTPRDIGARARALWSK